MKNSQTSQVSKAVWQAIRQYEQASSQSQSRVQQLVQKFEQPKHSHITGQSPNLQNQGQVQQNVDHFEG